jgi:hypothetical protein
MGAANRCARHCLSESVRIIREKLTREPTPANEIESAVHKAFSQALDEQTFWQSLRRSGARQAPAAVSDGGSVLTESEQAALARAGSRSRWPGFCAPNEAAVLKICDMGIITFAVNGAHTRGLLFIAPSSEGPAWLVCDHERKVAKARRLNGLPWQKTGKLERWLPGSEITLPVGLDDSRKPVFLGAGMKGLLRLHHLVWTTGMENDVTVAALLDPERLMHHDALPLLKDRKVCIFEHGANNALLLSVTSELYNFDFSAYTRDDGAAVRTLADLIRIDPDTWEVLRLELEELAKAN